MAILKQLYNNQPVKIKISDSFTILIQNKMILGKHLTKQYLTNKIHHVSKKSWTYQTVSLFFLLPVVPI